MKKLLGGVEEGLEVVEVEGKGRGVIPTRPFVEGEFVCEYAGELIPEEEAVLREEEYLKDTSVGCYMFFFQHKSNKWW